MISPTTESKLDRAMQGLEKLNVPDMNYIVDLLIAVAVESGRLVCMAHDELHFVLGQNHRKSFHFEDCGGRFRSVLSRLYSRCKASYPQRMEGNVYGFEADVVLSYFEDELARLCIRTANTQSFPELVIKVVEIE